jgi:hypothetical protein
MDLIDVPALRKEIKEELSKLRAILGQEDYVDNLASEILEALEIANSGKGN